MKNPLINTNQILTHTKIFLVLVGFLLVFFSGLPSIAEGASASLFLSPATGNYIVGSNFSIAVKVNTGGETINAADGTINFNPAQLQVLSLSKSDSIFTLWTEEPDFSNSSGEIRYGGGTPKNFNGTSGTIFTINFLARTVGTAKVIFANGSVLAADYKGTNVLGSLGSGTYVIQPTKIIPEYIPPEKAPAAPLVTSPTHPDSEKWYSNNDPRFRWEISQEITGVKYLATRQPISYPTFYSKPISEAQLKDLADDIWFFHVQLQNKFGWGGIAHFKFQIDTKPPNPFEIKIKEGNETTNPQPTLILEATDETSGIDYYEVKIDLESPIKVTEREYKMPAQTLGKHTIIVKAVDKAGNQTLAMTEINILSIEAPVITDYPKTLLPGSILSIKGTAIPDVTIKVYIQKDEKEIKTGETKSDKEGKWVFIEVEPVEKGVYEVWAEAIDSSGAKSKPSNKVSILVGPPIFIRIGKLAIDYLTTIITLLLLILAIILAILWAWRKIKERREKLKKEVTEAEKALYFAFKTLKEGTEEQVAKLDGQPGLSEREREICSKLKEALENSEKFITKEIEDIKRELEK